MNNQFDVSIIFIQVGQNCLFRMPNITRFMKIIFRSVLCVADMSFFLAPVTHIPFLGKLGTKKRLWELGTPGYFQAKGAKLSYPDQEGGKLWSM